MADTTLILGLAGVLGTIAGTAGGATIGARATDAVERRRQEAREREAADALRAAARLVWLDLAQVDASLAWAEQRATWHPDKVRLPMDAWEQYRDRLALGITDPVAWETVASGMAALTHTAATSATLIPNGPLATGMVPVLAEARRLVIAAAEVLRPIAGMPPRT